LRGEIAKAAKALLPVLQREEPEVIYMTHQRDYHPDHRAAVSIVRTALRGAGIQSPMLLSYEVLTPVTEYDRVEDISLVMQRKLNAVRAHRSQVRQLRYDFAVQALNRYRGVIARAGHYAEAFRLANGNVSHVPLVRRTSPDWHRVYEASQEITRTIAPEESYILVDEGQFQPFFPVDSRSCIPFLERGGRYWGKPQDDAIAIREVERLRGSGVKFIVFVPGTFWWLDYYSGLNRYLRARFTCVKQDSRLIVFDLRNPLVALAGDPTAS
jgi:hypothetical protein